MSVIWIDSGRFAVAAGGYDTDAQNYITAVEAADGQSLETAVKDAINAFVVGCKTDGIWSAIKASCVLAGARTLTGALVPLVGTAPTNNGFVSGDYNRKTGLIGNGSSKYLDSGRANNADPQNSQHLAVYVSTVSTIQLHGYIGDVTSAGASYIYFGGTGASPGTITASRNTIEVVSAPANNSTLLGFSRGSSSQYSTRINGATATVTNASATPSTGNIHVFRVNRVSGNFVYGAHRLAFYSIGEALTLALLDARLVTLMTALAAAIP